MDIKRAVGKRIKIVRQRNGLTQDQLAEQVGLSPKYISGIERGVENPTMDILIRLAKVLGVEPYDLFLFGESEESEKALRKGIEKMVREVDREKLQLYFDVMRNILQLT
ncbi:MAG: helix-turn-helix transcriptional regulator [Nitrospirota bacterium]|nr:helix-turn-helix transcriptional regulator [Nitrospirota bacterium]MDP3596774.1 helix-turn-helix transcriptional regulator [Nitrospirota bacterium]